MASYKVVIDKRVRKKDLPGIPTRDLKRIIQRIAGLADNPYPADAVRFSGRPALRLRQGNYRILYTVAEQLITVYVIKVGHRRDVYK